MNYNDMKAKSAMKNKGMAGEQEETRPIAGALKGQMFKTNEMSGIPNDAFEGMTEEEKNKKILDFNN